MTIENSKTLELINELKDDKFYSSTMLKGKFLNMLAILGFPNKSAYSQNGDIDVEIYEFNGDEQQLILQATKMLKEIIFPKAFSKK